MSYRPHDHAEVDPQSPRAFGVCDRCGALWNHWRLTKEYQWAGTQLVDTGNLACPKCFNPPSPFLKTIILPPDPTPIRNARTFNAADAEDNDISTESLISIDTEDDFDIITEIGKLNYATIDMGTESDDNIDAEDGSNIILDQQ